MDKKEREIGIEVKEIKGKKWIKISGRRMDPGMIY